MRLSNQVFWVFLEEGKIPEFLHLQGNMEANPQLLLAVTLVFDTQHVTVLADLMALHALVCFQVLSMVEGVRPAGVREEERPPPKAALFSALTRK